MINQISIQKENYRQLLTQIREMGEEPDAAYRIIQMNLATLNLEDDVLVDMALVMQEVANRPGDAMPEFLVQAGAFLDYLDTLGWMVVRK